MRIPMILLTVLIFFTAAVPVFGQQDELAVPFLGIKIDEGEEPGVLVTAVQENSPAEDAGFRDGDLLTKWGDRKMFDTSDFMLNLYSQRPGDVVTIRIKRDAQALDLKAKLGESEDEYADVYNNIPLILQLFRIEMMGYAIDELGIMTGNLPQSLMEYFEVEHGILVQTVEEGSNGAKKGFKPGDVIYEMNGKAMRSTLDFRAELNETDKVDIRFKRKGKDMRITMKKVKG